MSKKSYKQHCWLAQALDVVGERWTLLLVRELHTGPRRFGELARAMPGMGTNLLSARLKELEKQSLIQQVSDDNWSYKKYELTESGRELEPVLLSLARWGRHHGSAVASDASSLPHWTLLALRASFNPAAARGVSESYQFFHQDLPFYALVHKGTLAIELGKDPNASIAITVDRPTLVAIGRGELSWEDAESTGLVTIDGDRQALARLNQVFPLPEPEQVW